MDFDNKQQLWSKKYSENNQGTEIIENLDSYLAEISSPIGEDYQMIHQQESLTLIKVLRDAPNKRVVVRTETTPNTNPPKRLTDIFLQEKFTQIL